MRRAENLAENQPVRGEAAHLPFGPATIRAVAIEVDGRRTVGYRVTGRAGSTRPVIVGIAGWMRATRELFEITLALCAEFDVLLVEMPWSGGGSVSFGSASVEAFAAHVVDLVGAELPGRDVMLLGESFGAAIALEAALRPGFPRVRAAAFLDPPLSYASQLSVREYLRNASRSFPLPSPVFGLAEGDGFIRDADPDCYWHRLRAAGKSAGVLILAGGREHADKPGSLPTLFAFEDEERAAAQGLEDLAVVRFAHAGHLLLKGSAGAVCDTLVPYFLARCGTDQLSLGAASRALVGRPHDAGMRDALLRALRASPPHSRRSLQASLLAARAARPDDIELSGEILRVLAKVPDDRQLAAMRHAVQLAMTPPARIWAAIQAAAALFEMGDADGALDVLQPFRSGETLPHRLSSLIVNIGLYSGKTDDLSVAELKAANCRNVRTLLPPVAAPAVQRAVRGGKPRVGLVGGCLELFGYMSLLMPFLREIAGSTLDIEILHLKDDRLADVRRLLPADIAVRALDVLADDVIDVPARWIGMNAALRARELDLLVDLDESLAPHSPACVIGRPAPVQATWFNMSGPSLDPCFDAAIGPDTLYPPELDAAFPGRLARLPGDLYVFEPEIWQSCGVVLPPLGPPPMLERGHPTFGSLSHLYKISDACIALWAKVLHAVPGSRLYLGNSLALERAAVARVRAQFARCGIDPERIGFGYHAGWPGYLAGYAHIDIVLGTFPVAGGTTLFEALHLGMPVVSRIGRTSLGRIGRWLAAATGRPCLAHDSDESFVAEAVRLAAAPGEIAALRADEPARLRAKSRVDAGRMARAFEALAHELLLRGSGKPA